MVLPQNTLRSLTGLRRNKGLILNYKRTVFYVLISDESSEFDKALQNKVIKLRVYYTAIFLGKLSLSLLAELDLSAFVNIAKMEVDDLKDLAAENSILISLTPAKDSKGNFAKPIAFLEDLKTEMLRRIGVRLDDLSTRNRTLKISLLDLILPGKKPSEGTAFSELFDLKKYDLLNTISSV